MVLKVRLNSDDSKIYRLTSWDVNDFQSFLSLTVQSSDLDAISDDFKEIKKLEIFQDDILIAAYTNLDTYDEITFLRNEYVPGESIFTNAMRIHLTKTNIIEQVQRIDDQINPTVDVDGMDLEAAKEYKIKEIGAICRAEIYAGEQVTLTDGTVKNFSYTADDQSNILNSSLIAFASKTLGFPLEYIPYHPDETECQLMPVADLVNIYMTLQLKLTRLTTKCNMLNCMIRECTTKEDVLAITWDTELSPAYQQRYGEIVMASVQIAEAMANAMQPDQPDEEPTDEEPTDEEPTDEEPTDEDVTDEN